MMTTISKDKIIEKVKKIFSRPMHSVLGIDIGTETVKIVEVSLRSGHPQLMKLGITKLPEGIISEGLITNQEVLAESIKKLMEMNGFTAKDVILSVGGRSVFMREVNFPNMSVKELREAIKWDMVEYVPYAPDTYYYDCAIIGPSKTETEMRVLLFAVPKDNIDGIVSAVKAVGLRPLAVDTEALAIARTLDVDNCIVVDIGGALSQVTIYQQGCPVVNRTIPIAGHQYTGIIMRELDLEYGEAEMLKQRQAGLLLRPNEDCEKTTVNQQMEAFADDFIQELRRTAEYYVMQNKEAVIEKIFITGGGSKLDNLIRHLEVKVGIPVSLHNPLVALDNYSGLDKQFLANLAPHFGAAIGLVLRRGEL